MKAFRGEPSIFASARPEDKRAELEVKNLTLRFGGITALAGSHYRSKWSRKNQPVELYHRLLQTPGGPDLF